MRILQLLFLIPVLLISACHVETEPDQLANRNSYSASIPHSTPELVAKDDPSSVEPKAASSKQTVVEQIRHVELGERFSIAWLEGTAAKELARGASLRRVYGGVVFGERGRSRGSDARDVARL